MLQIQLDIEDLTILLSYLPSKGGTEDWTARLKRLEDIFWRERRRLLEIESRQMKEFFHNTPR